MNLDQCAVDLEVYALVDLTQDADDYSPNLLFAHKGDKLIIRRVNEGMKTYPISVSHPTVTDSTFRVAPSEITLIDPILTKVDQDDYKRRTGREHTER